MSGMSAWVTSDTTRWRRALTGSVRKSMVVTPNLLGPRSRRRELVPRAPRSDGRPFVLTGRLHGHPDAPLKRAAERHIFWYGDPAVPDVGQRERDPVAGGCAFTKAVRPTEPQADTSPG